MKNQIKVLAKSKYTKELREQAYTLANKGCTDAEIIKGLSIGKETFYKYLRNYPDFSDTIKRARKIPVAKVEAALFKKAIGYEVTEVTECLNKDEEVQKVTTKRKHVPGDVAAITFFLTNKAPEKWTNVQRTHLKADSTPMAFAPIVWGTSKRKKIGSI